MKVEIKSNTMIKSDFYEKGSVYDIEDIIAKQLIQLKIAVQVFELNSEEVIDEEIKHIETREEELKKKSYKRKKI